MELATPTIHKGGQVTHGDDRGLFVEFTMESIKQGFASEQAGHPIYKDVPHITIVAAGNTKSKLCRPVDMDGEYPDPVRFPQQWAAFQAQREQVSEGWSIAEWPLLTKSQVLELKARHIHTVEQVAAVTDANLDVLGLGGRDTREKAKLAISKAGDGAEVSKLVAENNDLKTRLAFLEKQMQQLGEPQEAVAKAPGRPRKTA